MARSIDFNVVVSAGVEINDDQLETIADQLDMDVADLSNEDIVNYIVSEANYELAFDSDHVERFSTEITEVDNITTGL